MALISCPECGGMVSDQAKACIHCGYPLTPKAEDNNYYSLTLTAAHPKKITGYFLSLLTLFPDAYKKYFEKFKTKYPILLSTGITNDNAKWLEKEFRRIRCTVEVKVDTDCTQANDTVNQFVDEERRGMKHCPYCRSTAITTGNRGFKLATGMLGANKVMNYCSNCGNKWEPE